MDKFSDWEMKRIYISPIGSDGKGDSFSNGVKNLKEAFNNSNEKTIIMIPPHPSQRL